MGRHLCSLKAGDTIMMKGPWKRLEYEANKYKKIGMIAGGTGLTPMLQVLREVLNNPLDKTKVTLVYGNQSEDQILLKDRLDAMAKDARFNVVYTVDRAAEGWTGETGYVPFAR
jgi:cytochrome-b5 reductase